LRLGQHIISDQIKFLMEYEIQNSEIIFNDKPYSNDFIPDTVFIYEDKIYLRRNKEGQPDEFANYFQVTKSSLDFR
jgi:hypothetical protein